MASCNIPDGVDFENKCRELPASLLELIKQLQTGQSSNVQLQYSLMEAHTTIVEIIKGLDCDTWEYKNLFEQYAADIKSLIIETIKKDVTDNTKNINKNTINDNTQEPCPDEAVIKLKLDQFAFKAESQGFSDVCGMIETLQQLKVMFILPLKQPQLYVNQPVYNTMLLYGPPGCGKTQLVHAFSKEINANLYCLTAGSILSKYLGESEKTLLHVFTNIRKLKTTTILFIDEIDAFCRTRTSSEEDYSRRLKVEFLNQLTINPPGCKCIIIAATNVPWDIDNAVMRRFQKQLFLGLPNRTERNKLINFYLKHVNLQNQYDMADAWNGLLDKTNGYSNSDLKEVVRCALHKPIEDLTKMRFWSFENGMYSHAEVSEDTNIASIASVYDLPPGTVKARDPCVYDLIASVDEVPRTVSDAEISLFQQFQNNRN